MLWLRGLHDHPEAFTSAFEEEKEHALTQMSARLAAGSPTRMWGAFSGTELVGVFGSNRETRSKGKHKADLIGMYVVPEFAGRGIGHALVDAVVRDARQDGITLLVLTVTVGNAKARALYTRVGFQSMGVEPDAIRVNDVSYGKEHLYLQLVASVPASSVPARQAG